MDIQMMLNYLKFRNAPLTATVCVSNGINNWEAYTWGYDPNLNNFYAVFNQNLPLKLKKEKNPYDQFINEKGVYCVVPDNMSEEDKAFFGVDDEGIMKMTQKIKQKNNTLYNSPENELNKSQRKVCVCCGKIN